ncbi:MAG: tetratricopeptide repeat protein [Candidatus Omnitrophota bacterium]
MPARLKGVLVITMVTLIYTSALALDQAPVSAPADIEGQIALDTSAAGCTACEALKSDYYKDNRYGQLFDFLDAYKNKSKALAPCLDYYKALARFDQLKYLEENQSWDEYFSQGNTYREQIVDSANKAVSGSPCGEAVQLKGLLLLWQFHQDQQDAFAEQSLEDLSRALSECAPAVKDPQAIKVIADKLMAYGEKLKARQAYKLYVDKIVTQETKDADLKGIAADFYKDGNLSLSESVYDIYIARITQSLPKEQLAKEMLEIAGLFVYKPGAPNDMLYAEKVFKAVDQLGLKDIFSQELIYLRGFNLEKAKAYREAAVFYAQIAKDYPKSSHYEEVLYKLGLINMYVLGDMAASKSYFDQLVSLDTVSVYTLSALYQEGLLLQWQGDNTKAKELYNLLLSKAQDKFPELVKLTNIRLKEIEEAKPLDYNLKTFLELSSQEPDKGTLDNSKTELSSSDYILDKGQKITLSSNSYLPQSGCLQVDLQYLWSGNTGSALVVASEGNFQTTYSDAGTKEVSLVVVSPTGVIGRSFDLLDVR